MYNREGFEQWFKSSKNFTMPFGEMNKATTEFLQRLTQENLEIMEENFSLWAQQLNRLCYLKSPEDFANYLKECTNENIHAAIQNVQKLAHVSMKNMEEFSKSCAPFHENLAKTMEKVSEKIKAKTKKKKK